MTISVLISVYRSEKAERLDRSLKSVWTDQTLKPMEIVLIIDGPVGSGLHTVISRWKRRLQDRLVVIVNRINLGLTKSLNIGLATAKGDLIARMDSDDVSLPDRFETQHDYLLNHPDVDILGGCIREFDDTCPDLGTRRYPVDHESIRNYLHKGNPLAHSAVMFRRSIYTRGLRYDESFRKNQDLNLWFRAVEAGYVINNLDRTVVMYRRDPGVYRRRGKGSAILEFRIYMQGIHRLHGIFTPKYAYPIARLLFRLMPREVIRKIYGSTVRKFILEK